MSDIINKTLLTYSMIFGNTEDVEQHKEIEDIVKSDYKEVLEWKSPEEEEIDELNDLLREKEVKINEEKRKNERLEEKVTYLKGELDKKEKAIEREKISSKKEQKREKVIKNKNNKPKKERVINESDKKVRKKSIGSDNSGEEWRTFEATAYTASCEGCSGITKTGVDVKNATHHNGNNIIAVDPSVIPLGSLVEIKINGKSTMVATAQDIGGAIKGNRIDILVGSNKEANNFGRQTVKVRILK